VGETVLAVLGPRRALIVDEQKMSKSLGNTHTIPDIVARGFRPSAVRYLLLSAHYRKQLNFTWASLGQAEEALRRLTDFLARVDAVDGTGAHPEVAARVEAARAAFAAAMQNDLSTARRSAGCSNWCARSIRPSTRETSAPTM
jgi:cysteinyl-tRNA synthetase